MDRPAFLWIGNHPGIDFVNTAPVIGGERVELFRDVHDVLEWAEAAGALRPGIRRRIEALPERSKHRLVRSIHDLRDRARRCLDSGALQEAERAALNDHLARLPTRLAVERADDRVRLDLRASTPEAQLHLDLARLAVASLVDLDPRRIRRCANPECVLYFYDTSKNAQRRWCDMATCGNRAKVALHYRRTRDGRGGPRPAGDR